MILSSEQAQTIVERLKESLDPLWIYLFGSQANGTASGEDSDIDLLVVVRDDGESPLKKSARAYKCLRDMKVPKDIIVRHQSLFEERSRWLNSLEREILEQGTILYSR